MKRPFDIPPFETVVPPEPTFESCMAGLDLWLLQHRFFGNGARLDDYKQTDEYQQERDEWSLKCREKFPEDAP